MPSFLQYQEQARKRTRRLVLLYVLCLCCIVGVFYALPVWGMYALESDGRILTDEQTRAILWQPQLFLWIVGIVVGIVGGASLVKTMQLSAGGAAVAESLGGRRVAANTKDPAERRLLNVVEEMAIASRIAIPAVYVLDGEPGINAFAAGYSPSDASVTVTAGALEHFNREELQSVVGHEFSHILNGDMRLNVRLIATIFGIICIAVLGRIAAQVGLRIAASSRPRRSKDDNSGVAIGLGIAVIGLLVWLIGSVGVFFGRLLQAVISRQREYLADASSVQFTRNPHGMASALKVIGATAEGSSVANPKASEISHMFFASGFAGLFATHPPLEDRIRRYDASFAGDYGETRRILARRAELRAAGATEQEEEEDPFLRRILFMGGIAAAGAQGAGTTAEPPPAPAGGGSGEAEPPPAAAPKRPARLGFNEKRELASLPGRIEALETEIAALEAALCDGTAYARDPVRAAADAARLPAARSELEAVLERWMALEELASGAGRERAP